MGKPQSYDYVIVGGGVAGVTAAEEIRARSAQHHSSHFTGTRAALLACALASLCAQAHPARKTFSPRI